MSHTPINEFKLKTKSKEFLKDAKKMSIYSVKNIYVPSDIFDDLLEAITPSDRSSFVGGIPYCGKVLVRV